MLPFGSIEDAESYLHRNLTAVEIVWFHYSARKSDFVLHCHNTVFLCIFYSVLPLPYMALELLQSRRVNAFKIQPKVKNSLCDMLDCYKKVMFTFIFGITPLQTFSYPLIKIVGIRTSLPLPSGWEIFWQLVVYFMVEDYSNYWLHRLLHCKWGFDNIHHVHHEYNAPMGFAAPYGHWSEIIILGVPSFIGPAIVPGHMITFWLFFILRQMEAIETHSGYDFPWNPINYIPFYGGSAFHDYHHFVGANCHSNFASVFTYCDTIYGTNKGYQFQKEFGKARQEQSSERVDGGIFAGGKL